MEKIKPRHPEKVKKPINPIKKKPVWIRSKLSDSKEFFLTKTVVNQNNLVTVCQEANCPNITECWSKRHATFMIMGDTCTRACAFCDVKTGKPEKLDPFEHIKIANCSGFYGDKLSAARDLVEGGPIDILTGDYLAELTMTILYSQKNLGNLGVIADFNPVYQIIKLLRDSIIYGNQSFMLGSFIFFINILLLFVTLKIYLNQKNKIVYYL